MSDVTVSSTTDTLANVNAAAGILEDPETQEVQETDEEPQSTEATPAKTKAKDEEKTPRAIDKRIDKLTKEREDAKREALELKAKVEELEKRAAPEPKAVQPVAVPETFPSFDQWSEQQVAAGKSSSNEDYIDARTDWRFEQREQQKEAAAAKAREDADRKAVFDSHAERVVEFRKTHNDWADVVENSQIQIPSACGPAILELDNSADVMYYLGSNPEVCKQLMGMKDKPARAVAEIGRISARLESAPGDEEKPRRGAQPDRTPVVSRAPAPITPLSGHATRSTLPLDELPFSEYRKVRDRQEKDRYKR